MAQYQRKGYKFVDGGINVSTAPDMVGEDEYPYLLNMYSATAGVLQPRPGLAVSLSAGHGSIVNIKRVNNEAPGAAFPFQRFVMDSAGVLAGGENGQVDLDSGYSGNPVSMLAARPPQSAETWLYIADTVKMTKIRTDQATVQFWGISPPTQEPVVSLFTPAYKVVDNGGVGWTAGGIAGTISNPDRAPASTTILAILYDSGTTGWACVAFTNPSNNYAFLGRGAQLTFGASGEQVMAEQVFPILSNTTVGAILYDNQTTNTGLCTICMATPFRGLARDQMLQVGAEYVRVISVTVGPDGLFSFRCSTVGTIATSASISSVPAIRVYLASNHAVGTAITSVDVQALWTLGTGTTQGLGTLTHSTVVDLSQINGRPVQADDYMHVSILVDAPENVLFGRVCLDVDAATNDFTQNFYYQPFEPNDFTQASQGTASQTTSQQQSIGLQQIRAYDPTTYYESGQLGAFDNAQLSDGYQQNPYAANPISASEQATTGDLAWTEFLFKIADLQRVGADTTRTLANVKAIRLELTVTGNVTVQMNSWWVGGTFGPDALDTTYGVQGFPLVYRYRYRNSKTGAISIQSPPLRSGVLPRRQRVLLAATPCADPQVDMIDWEGFGGSSETWHYVASSPNTGTATNVDLTNAAVLANDPLSTVAFAPFPVADQPRSGTVQAFGSAIQWASGDQFNTKWAPGTTILVNGIAHQLSGPPASATVLNILDSADFGTFPYLIAEPTIMGQPLPYVWGPDQQGRYFGAGDTRNPGMVYVTNSDEDGGIESVSDQTVLEVSGPSEPVLGGVILDSGSIVFTSERIIELQPSYGENTLTYTPITVDTGNGLFAPYGYCVGGGAVYYWANDGIRRFGKGGGSENITEKQLGVLFPHNSLPLGQSIIFGGIPSTTINPPDYTSPKSLRMSYADGYLFADYQDVFHNWNTLAQRIATGAWHLWQYGQGGATVHYQEEAGQVNTTLVGTSNGSLCLTGTGTGDDGAAIQCAVYTRCADMGETRARKQFGDIMLDVALRNSIAHVFVTFDNFSTVGPTQTITNNERGLILVDLNDGLGDLYRNISIGISFTAAFSTDVPTVYDQVSEMLYEWQPSFLLQPENSQLRCTDWDDASSAANKFIQGVLLNIDTAGMAKLLKIQTDAGQSQTCSVSQSGQGVVSVSFNPPLLGHQMRIVPLDAVSWRIFGMQWIWEPQPESVDNWISQTTTHGLNGFQHMREVWFPYNSSADSKLTVTVDGNATTYDLPSSSGVNTKIRIDTSPLKGKLWSYSTIGGPIAVFQEDLEVRVKEWGSTGPYQIIRPFGGESRQNGGARI